MPNTELLKRTLRHIEEHPADWIQDYWYTPQSSPSRGKGCGTAYCFAGWAVALSGCEIDNDGRATLAELPSEALHRLDTEHHVFTDDEGRSVAAISDVAAALLDIPSYWNAVQDDGEHLFDDKNTLDDLRRHVAELCGETPEALS